MQRSSTQATDIKPSQYEPASDSRMLMPGWGMFALAVGIAISIVSLISHWTSAWFGLQTANPIYRRTGPSNGPQVFVAGSSLLQFGLGWPEISEKMGQGMECWALGGSSPEVWEISQRAETNSNAMIVGFSVYDLNEEHLCDSRANIVPLFETLHNLWTIRPGWGDARHILSQYPLSWVRTVFPTAGKSDAVLTGLRRKFREVMRMAPPSEEKANALVLPKEPTLDFGDSNEKLSNWASDKALRRISLIRSEIHGVHRFDGLQRAALFRMLDWAQARGKIYVAVMPVAPSYAREFLSEDVTRALDATLSQAQQRVPQACFVRLDRLSSLADDALYSDFIHLNAAGRRIATKAFLDSIQASAQRQ